MTYHDSDANSPNFGDGFKKIWTWIKNLMNIKDDAEVEGTIKGIKDGIEFKGTNVWILICSIIMASIGLNINAVGVIIGAMLIAPLMGPILGMGLSVGTNDFETLKTSLKAFGIMTAIGLITSTVYFMVSPIKAETSEILGRTAPTFLDALVALFGGLAGIVAGSRKEKSNVIPGVAIATALMPPLCTAGYGIAMGNSAYFMGAAYLFILNSVLIALATYLGVKYLEFPTVHLVDAVQDKKVKRIITVFTIIVLVPSGFILYNVTNESLFSSRADSYIDEVVNYDGMEIINHKLTYNSDSSTIEVFTIGERVPDKTILSWKNQLSSYKLLNTKLEVFQNKEQDIDLAGKLLENAREGLIKDIYDRQADQMKSKDEKIKFLEAELVKHEEKKIPFARISKEISVNYPEISEFSCGTTHITDTSTIYTFIVKWEGTPRDKVLGEWLKVRLDKDTVRVLNY